MKKHLKRFAAIALAFLTIVSMLTVAAPDNGIGSFIMTAYAASSGTCGDNLTWEIIDDTLTISGSGAMYNYSIYDPDAYCPWYSYRADIKNVVIEEGVTSIGAYAFEGLKSYESLTLPTSVSQVRDSFLGEYMENPGDGISIDRVYFSGTVDQWKASPFYKLSFFKWIPKLYCGGELTEILNRSGKAGDSMTWELYSTGRLVISGSGTMYDWNDPEYLEAPWGDDPMTPSRVTSVYIDKDVEKISNVCASFSSCRKIHNIDAAEDSQYFSSIDGVLYNKQQTELVCCPPAKEGECIIADTVTSIGNSAFYNCSKLTSVTLPAGLETIGTSAFSYCPFLTDVTLPDSVKTIGAGAFYSCSNLKSAYIPALVTELDASVFSGCNALETINVAENNTIYSSVDGVLFNKGKTEIIRVPGAKSGTYTVPGTVTELSDSTFSGCSKLEKVVLSEGITGIGQFTFSNCTSLSEISLPSTLTSIGKNAFSGCTSLTGIVIPDSVKSIGSNVFSGCSKLSAATIPSGLLSIPDGLFYNCTSLESITIPDGVRYIGGSFWGAFEGCTSLREVTLPVSVLHIEHGAFDGCKAITDVYYEGSSYEWAHLAIDDFNNGLLSANIHYAGGEVPAETYEEDLEAILTTALPVGSKMNLQFNCEGAIYIDWGDGNIVPHSADGVTKGQTIKIYCRESGEFGGYLFGIFCEGNQLTDIDISPSVGLYELRCSDNLLTSLDVTDNIWIDWLICSDNQLTELKLGNKTQLTLLSCGNNKLTELDLERCYNINDMYVAGNLLTELDVTHMPNLRELYCENNPLRFSTMKGVTKPETTYYSPQLEIEIPATIATDESIDLSSEYNIDGTKTVYSWYDAETGAKITPTSAVGGVFAFGKSFIGRSFYCKLTNNLFPELTLVTSITEIKAGNGVVVEDATDNDAVVDTEIDDELTVVDKNNNLIDISGIKLIVGNVDESNKKTVADAIADYNEFFDIDQSTYAMYDISLVDKSNNAKVEVIDGRIKIMLKIPENFPGQNKEYTFNLYHYKDDGTIEEIPITLTNGRSHFFFYADEFSPFVLVCSSIEQNTPRLDAYTFGYTSIKLTWNKIAGATGYAIYRCDKAGQPYKYITSIGGGETSYRDINLSTGTTYYYKIKAFVKLDDGTKLYSDLSAYASARPLPATPVVTAVRTSATTANISWVKIYGATGYSVYRSTEENGEYTFVANLKSGDTTTYKATGLASSKTYYYKVRAYRQMGDDMMFGSYSKPAAAFGAPAVPTITARSVGYTSAKVLWDPVKGADGYAIYRCDVGGGAYSYITSVGADVTTYTNTGLSTGTTYYYKVRAFVNTDSGKLYSNYSPCATARPIPATPVVTVAADAANNATISWVKIYGATGYSVYRSTEKDGTYSFLAGISSGDTVSFTDKNTDEGVTYYYKVRAYRQMGKDMMFGEYSKPAYVK